MAQRLQSMDEPFKGRHLEREVIVLYVRWYLPFKLSLRDVVETVAERGLALAAREAGRSWRVDETYYKGFPQFASGIVASHRT